MNPLFKIETTDLIAPKLKKKISLKMKNVLSATSEVEKASSLPYPPYYVEPVLTVTTSPDHSDGIGVLYARTIPVENRGSVEIIVQISGALVLFGTKTSIRLILSHEFLHYLELVRNFSKGIVTSEITSTSVYEEYYTDLARALDPSKVFKNKKLTRDLKKKMKDGLDDEKLNEKCTKNWIDKGLPMAKIPMGRNQVHLSMESVMRSRFEPRALAFLSELDNSQAGRK
jgi:hypothetical protein